MIEVNLNGTAPTHVERIKPQMSVDNAGNVIWTPGLSDHDASLFYRGKTVTNDEFNTLFMRGVYQGNYITDSLTELFNKHLGTAIYRSFTSDFKLVPSYIKTFTSADWGTIQEDGYYYITISASEHGFIPDEELSDIGKMNIDTEMYVLGNDGRFAEVTQIDTDPDNTVRLYTDDPTISGFVVIRTNDKAYALATETIEASQIRGLADVATSARYTDLVDINSATGPNTRITANLNAINAIISGETPVAEAMHSVEADTATNLLGSGTIQNIAVSNIFETGSSYVKNATKAKDYDTTTGSIKGKFDILDNKNTTQDNTVNNLQTELNSVKNNYYKKTDTVTNATNAAKATNDAAGRNIQNTYTTGMVLEPRANIEVEIWVSDEDSPTGYGASTKSLFFNGDSTETVTFKAFLCHAIGEKEKYIINAAANRHKSTQGRYDYQWVLIRFTDSTIQAPTTLHFYANSTFNSTDAYYYGTHTMTTGGTSKKFYKYAFSNWNYDFSENANVTMTFSC